jgi:methionine-rich copper-binding protein CopC
MKRSRTLRLAPRLLLGLIATLPTAAFAHAHLESAQPARGSANAASPPQVVLKFSEPVALMELTLERAAGGVQKLEPLPRDAASTLSVPLPKLADGAYTVHYKVVSDDTHEAKGMLRFTVGAAVKPAVGKPQAAKHD